MQKYCLTLCHSYLFVFIIFGVMGCVKWIDYIPRESTYYRIQEKKIVYENSKFNLEIKGRYGRPNIYLIGTEFDIKLINKTDSLKFEFRKVNLLAEDVQKDFYFSDFITEGGRKKVGKIIIPPYKERNFHFYHGLKDSSLVRPADYIKKIKLVIDGLYDQNNAKIETPDFLFLAEPSIEKSG